MNKIRIRFVVVAAALALACGSLRAQTSMQTVTFSLIGEFQTNSAITNFSGATPVSTNETLTIHPILITTASVVKSLALDLEGTNWATWLGARLVREVNLTNGAEGMFLIKGTNHADVSRFFGSSFSNNFTGDLGKYIGNVTNGFANSYPTNANTNFNFPTNAALIGGKIFTGATTNTTNFTMSAGLYTLSMLTTNIQFNAFGVGSGLISNVRGVIDGTTYEKEIGYEAIGTAGAFYINTSSNIFGMGTNLLPLYIGGPLHGGINTSVGTFSDIAGP